MKRLASLFLLLCGASPAAADNLCDAACLITLNFSDAGYIEAHETLTFSFGDGGLIDTGTVVMAQVAGDTLVLNAGERLDFAAGGSLLLGNGGNLDFTSVEFNNASTIDLEAVGGPALITIAAGSTLTLSGNSNLHLVSNFSNSGTLIIKGGTINITGTLIGSPCASSCEVANAAGATLSISSSSGAPLFIDPNLGALTASLTISENATFSTSGSIVLSADNASDLEETESNSSSGSSVFDFWMLLASLGLLVLRQRRQ